METPVKCGIGIRLNDDCHLGSYTEQKDVNKFGDLKEEDIKLLYLRIPNIKDVENQTVYSHHYYKFVNYYSTLFGKKCCHPWNIHKKTITTNLAEIKVDLSEKFMSVCKINVIPGKKLCKNCLVRFGKEISDFEIELTYCIDPYKKHRSKIFSGLEFLPLEYIKYLEDVHNVFFSCEHKICSVCKTQIKSDITEYIKRRNSSASASVSHNSDS